MPLTVQQNVTISDDPEPGFMVTIREWDGYCGRIKRLADPLENPYGWAQVFGAIAVAMAYATIALPQKDDHPYRYATHLGAFLASAVLTVFFIWIGWRQKKVRPETVESIVDDMEKHRDAKAPSA